MASTRLIKRRIKSAKNIAQITRAMEMVAASKMKKSQNAAIAGKPYAQKIYEAVYELTKKCDSQYHRLLRKNLESNKSLIILISTNKGLCGGLNTNLFRAVNRWYSDKNTYDFITLGKKSENFVIRSERKLLASFGTNGVFLDAVGSIIQLTADEYLKDNYREVFVIYNNFISALKQEPQRKKILPLGISIDDDHKESAFFSEFVIEPDYEKLLDSLIPHYLENQLRSAILESEASEHSARMVAMKNATDNAKELMTELTLVYNKIRQEKITTEIADMVTARMAVI